jgi:NAD(P)H-dependent FMN reductase
VLNFLIPKPSVYLPTGRKTQAPKNSFHDHSVSNVSTSNIKTSFLTMSYHIVAFGASNSRQSINRQLAAYTAEQIAEATVTLLDLNDYEMPIYSIDREQASGIPQLAHDFKAQLQTSDGIVISFAEHNGAYSTAFKNIFDWISRIDNDLWGHKPMFLLATSPGGRGGSTVLDIALNKFKFMNTNVLANFSLPFFGKHFSTAKGITDSELASAFQEQLNIFVEAMEKEAVLGSSRK